MLKVVRSLGKSRKWLHHWINRYKTNSTNENWFLDESKAPKKTHPSIDAELEQNILLIRNDLVNVENARELKTKTPMDTCAAPNGEYITNVKNYCIIRALYSSKILFGRLFKYTSVVFKLECPSIALMAFKGTCCSIA